MIRLVTFKAEHAASFSNRDGGSEPLEFWQHRERGGPGWTAMIDGKPVACGGLFELHQGVAAIWAHMSEDFPRVAITANRFCRALLRFALKTQYHRIEAVVLADNTRNHKWLESLGMRSEGGVAHKYTTDGRDAVRYEMVRE